LLVDTNMGTLLAGGAPDVRTVKRPKATADCEAANDRKQLTPLSATDMRAGGSAGRC
jgi:hypothetical protein